jgi:TetR/AcrR family transcriptional regulator
MARPPELEKRRDLARRGADVLLREGLELPMARLADALGVKRPTLLYHFPTIGHLLEAALEDLLTEQAAFVLARLEGEDDPLRRLDAQIRAVHAFHEGREARIVFLTQAIAATGGRRLPQIVATADAVFEAHRRAAAERLREGIAAGAVSPCDADAVVDLVRAVIDGLMVQRVVTGRALGPVHDLLRDRLLEPLRAPKEPRHAPTRRRARLPTQSHRRARGRT